MTELPTRPATPYDLVEYPARPRATTQPDRLATIARLYGIEPKNPRNSRVLELGCSDGGNLIAMAVASPKSEFVGLDAAPSAIEEGKELLGDLGLPNVELRCVDLLELEAPLGSFDYVIAHGVYSWVPEAVRAKLLAACKRNLAPNGVAMVSYSTYPGCHERQMAREMMLFHVRGISNPEERIREALTFLQTAVSAQPEGTPGRVSLEHELQQLAKAGSSFVYHDALAPENRPFYFEEFAARAGRAGLQYLSEAQFFTSYEAAVETGFVRWVPERARSDVMRAEQYLDFLRGRAFRQTVMVHDTVTIDRAVTPARIHDLLVCGRIRPLPDEEQEPDRKRIRYQNAEDVRVSTDSPFAMHAFELLTQAWPAAIPFRELHSRTLERGGSALENDDPARALDHVLFRCFAGNLLDLQLTPSPFTLAPGERPIASPLARHQARSPDTLLTSLRHSLVSLNFPLGRALVRLLDGTRTREELAVALAHEMGADKDPATGDPLDAARVDRMLRDLASLALLVA